VTAGPAAAIDDTKPAQSCFGALFTDKAGDNVRAHPAFAGEPGTENLDLITGFMKYDAAKGDDASTVNIQVKNLTKDVPQGSTSLQWQLDYVGKAGALAWVRAVTDFSGLVTYDYGGQQDASATTLNVRQGATAGNFFEGPDGIVQIVIPAALEPKGQALKTMVVHAYEPAQAVPGAAPTPIKGGQLYEQDNAGVKGQFVIGAACPVGSPPAAPPATGGTPKPATPAVQAEGPLPVKVTTTKFKAKKVKKGMTLKLTASEPITQLAAQIKKGTKVLGKGTLAKLSGKGSLKLKAKGLKKGSYVLDLVGTDAKGARRFVSAKIKVS
jgi:hypothetical protein